MNHVERFKAAMNFQPVDRLCALEWAPWWDKTIDRWHGEGLPAELTDAGDIRDYFGLDCHRQLVIHPFAPDIPDRSRPRYQGWVDDTDGYLQLKHFLYPRPAPHDSEELDQWAQMHDRGEMILWATFYGYFWHPRELLGVERHLYAFYDQPELIHMINNDLAEFNLRALDELCSIVKPDFMSFAEDMSYNHGPMLSKSVFDEFLAPYYRRTIQAFRDRGILVMVDSDGDVTSMLGWIEEVGVEGILPLERMAGVDVAVIRARHPRLRMLGAFDKTVMKHGPDAMRQEFERLLPTLQKGGFICSVDHQTPPDVSLDRYREYLVLLQEYVAKAGRPSRQDAPGRTTASVDSLPAP